MVLQSSIVTISALLITLPVVPMPILRLNVSLAATTAQYLMVYMIMLIAYMVLKRKHEDYHRMYYMSKNPNLSIAIAVLALIITVIAFFVTFVPAQGKPSNLRHVYVWTLIGMCTMCRFCHLFCIAGMKNGNHNRLRSIRFSRRMLFSRI